MKRKVITIALVLLSLAVVGGLVTALTQSHRNLGSASQSTGNSSVSRDPKSRATHYQSVLAISGHSPKHSSSFKSEGNKLRISYSVSGGAYATLYIYIVAKGESRPDFPDIDLVSDQGGSKSFSKPAGEYYLVIDSNQYSSWNVKVADLR